MPALPHVQVQPDAWAKVHESYDGETRRWVEGVLRGDPWSHMLPAADPEAAHDVARLRGVLPALAELYGRTGRSEAAECMRALMTGVEWYADRRPEAGWDSTTVALRLLSMLEALELVAKQGLAWPVPSEWLERFVARHAGSLATGQYLEPAGNHRLINAVGRCAAQLLVRPDARLPRELAEGLASVLREQWLPDGGHTERAPHYHCQALSLAAAIATADARRGGDLRVRLADGLRLPVAALAAMQDGTGAPLRLSDCSRTFSGRLPEYDARAAASWGPADVEPGPLPDFGVHRRRWSAGGHELELFADCGRMGSELNRGHAHADALSFLLYVDGVEVFSDPGTYLYSSDAASTWYKLPQAHSTIHWPSSPAYELASFFRWRRIPPPPLLLSETGRAGRWELCAGQGSGSPGRRFEHVRWWSQSGRGLTITDQVSSSSGEPVEVRFHLAPGVEVVSQGCSEARLRAQGICLRVRILSTAGGNLVLCDAMHSARYGLMEPSRALLWRVGLTRPCTAVLTTIEVVS